MPSFATVRAARPPEWQLLQHRMIPSWIWLSPMRWEGSPRYGIATFPFDAPGRRVDKLVAPTIRLRRTLSLILWKSKTLSDGILYASHSRYHFFSRTGLPMRERYVSFLRSFSGSKSPSSQTLLLVRARVVRFGAERWRDGEMVDIRLLAISSVWRRFSSGKLPRVTMELSVKSIASC